MPTFDLAVPVRVHIIAIGGAAMSAIAMILHQCGHEVSGSDQSDSPVLRTLQALGVEVAVGHNAEHLASAAFVVYSAAIKPGNVELDEAQRRGIPCLSRADAMEAICRTKRVLAVSGAHGKTTTSSMLATLFVDAGESPSFLVGATIARFGSGVRWTNDSDWFILEADESDGSFLRAHAEAVIVTNADPDHLDYWGTEDALRDGYRAFLREARIAVVCIENEGSAELAESATADQDASPEAELGAMHTYGWAPRGMWSIANYQPERLGSHFSVREPDGTSTELRLSVSGDHNALNATAAFALARRLGISAADGARSLASFDGVARRFEFRGEARGVSFVDDYAHLPAEVHTNIIGAQRAGWNRVVAVFQPHRYTRVRDVGVQFGPSFGTADVVIVTGLYAAGQSPIHGVSGRTVFDAVVAARPNGEQYYCETRAEVVALLTRIMQSGDLVLTMNAGDLTTLPTELLASSWANEGTR